jgi:hypothetical protein
MEHQGKSRITDVAEAREVVIELGERSGDVENLTRASNYVVGGLDAFLKSISRRAKYNFLMNEVVAAGHVGFFPKEVVYDGASIGWDTPYRIVTTDPEGDVQITPKTVLTCKLIDLK